MKNNILVKRNYLVYKENEKSKNFAHYAVKLLNGFAVEVDKPEFLTETHIKTVATFFGDYIPKSFYNNPQDLKYFTCDELLIEQMVSYLTITANGTFTNDKDVYKRKEIFKKILPTYAQSDETNIRHYKMINEDEADKILLSIASDFANYSRPWSTDELVEFKWLYMNNYYKGQPILCKDNLIELLFYFKDKKFAMGLDKKDIVKMSRLRYGDLSYLDIPDDDAIIFKMAIEVCKDCPLSKKQAKFFNSLLKNCCIDAKMETNEKSPYKKAKALIKEGKVYEAGVVFSENGSLLERNLVWLLSRASIEEIPKIFGLIKDSNPIVLIQLLSKILDDNGTMCRTFVFSFNRKVKSHKETEEEHKKRKSILSVGIKSELIKLLEEKIDSYYNSLPKLGKIYVSDEFKKVAAPLNTSAMGMGLDILPVGSRLPISGDYIRTFCYWNNAFDIDTSIAFIDENGNDDGLSFINYSMGEFGSDALHSGDCRDKDGAEYIDLDIKALKNRNIKYAFFVINGFGASLNEGQIYCGYQNKKNIKTAVWSTKNIELKIHVKGDSRVYIGFGIDFERNEIVILNQVVDSNSQIMQKKDYISYLMYLKPYYLDITNMYKILSLRGELVSKPEDADVVFDNNYQTENDNQQVIKSTNIEKMVNMLK